MRQRDRAAARPRPDEASTLQALAQQARAIAGPPQHLDQIAAPAAKNKHMSTVLRIPAIVTADSGLS